MYDFYVIDVAKSLEVALRLHRSGKRQRLLSWVNLAKGSAVKIQDSEARCRAMQLCHAAQIAMKLKQGRRY
jgi:hypothetical protein